MIMKVSDISALSSFHSHPVFFPRMLRFPACDSQWCSCSRRAFLVAGNVYVTLFHMIYCLSLYNKQSNYRSY